MKFLEFYTADAIQEARRNPEQNPRLAAYDQFKKIYDSLTIEEKKRSGVSMTVIDKVGVNPRSPYDTPIGIYAYPIEYVEREVSPSKNFGSLPFAGKSKFVNVISIKPSANVLMLNDMTEKDYHEWTQKIMPVFMDTLKKMGSTLSDARLKTIYTRIVADAPSEAYHNTPSGKFWYITWTIANEYLLDYASDRYPDGIPVQEIPHHDITQKELNAKRASAGAPILWNKFLRDLGLDVIIDNGEGTIHSNERNQMLILSMSAIEKITRIENKRNSPENALDKSEINQRLVKLFKDASITRKNFLTMVRSIGIDTTDSDRFSLQGTPLEATLDRIVGMAFRHLDEPNANPDASVKVVENFKKEFGYYPKSSIKKALRSSLYHIAFYKLIPLIGPLDTETKNALLTMFEENRTSTRPPMSAEQILELLAFPNVEQSGFYEANKDLIQATIKNVKENY